MNSPTAYLNGRFISAADLSIPVSDLGFIHGVTISEQMRTFDGKIFQLEKHLDRFWRGLDLLNIAAEFTSDLVAEHLHELAEQNYRILAPGGDLGVCLFATPGRNHAFEPSAFFDPSSKLAGATIAAHVYPLPFGRWAEAYERGVPLVKSSYQEVPAECWPKAVKCRSRMHYYLAELEAQSIQAGAKPFLTDADGNIGDSSIASLIFYDSDRGLLAPPHNHSVNSISVAVVREFAEQLSVPFLETEIAYADVHAFSEVMLASTPWCLLPVSSLDGIIVSACPGPMFQQLIEHWSRSVGVAIVNQAAGQ